MCGLGETAMTTATCRSIARIENERSNRWIGVGLRRIDRMPGVGVVDDRMID